MALILNEEEILLKDSAKELFKQRGSIETNLRRLRDSKDEKGFSQGLWEEMINYGWSSLIIPETYMGLDFGYVGLGQILEEAGRTLTPSPLISTALLSTTAINLAGNDTQKSDLLSKIAEGKLIVAFALDEGKHHTPNIINSSISKSNNKMILNGKKTMVIDGHIANKIIVVVKSEEENIQFVVVDPSSSGINIERTTMMDSTNISKISFDNVEVDPSNILDNGNMDDTLEKVLDIARIGISAEMLGGIQEAFERSVEYIKTREQFGLRIGTFQALQHRAAKMFCEIEICKSIVLKALKAIDNNDENLSLIASTAKAKTGRTYKLVSNEGIQFFGGIGMTDDEEIGFFLKRARVLQRLFGTYNFHLDRYATLKGY